MSAFLLSVCVLASPSTTSPTSDAVALSLAAAFRDHHVTVMARSHSGHSIARLEIRNRTRRAVAVDVNGSYLVPSRSGDQRLGIGIVRAGDSDTSIRLRPGERRRVKVLSVCMDAAKNSPRDGSRYRLARELAPKETLVVLRKWKAHPDVSQSEIQSAVWSGRPARTDLARRRVQERLPRNLREVAAFRGGLFALTEDNVLHHSGVGSDGGPKSFESVPGHVDDLWVGSALFAIRKAIPRGQTTGVLGTVLSRFDAETRGWADLDIDLGRDLEEGRLEWVADDGAKAFVRSPEGALFRVTAKDSRRVLDGVTMLVISRSGKVFAVRDSADRQVLGLSREGRARVVLDHRLPIRGLGVAGRSLYVLDSAANLIVVEGRRPRCVASHVEGIEIAGSRLFANVAEHAEAFVDHPAELLLYRGGGAVRRLDAPAFGIRRALEDRDTGTLYALGDDGVLRQLDPSRRTWRRLYE